MIMVTHIGGELRRLRKIRRQTLAEVGRAVSISVSTLSDIERGNTSPSLDTVSRLAQYYTVPIDSLLASQYADVGHKDIPGFSDFMKQMGNHVNDNVRDLLIQINYTAREPAVTKEDWIRNYYLLDTMVG